MRQREALGGTLVVGGGYGGSTLAWRLGDHRCTLVSPENFMLFAPLLPEAASGTLEPRHTVVPLRQLCSEAEFILGRVAHLDLDRKVASVQTETGELEVAWRRLVVAVGSVSRHARIPGLADHSLGFKDLADAITLRNHVLRQLELADAAPNSAAAARRLTFVFVGAGYAGVESLAELSDLVDDAMSYYPRLQPVPKRWVLVDHAPKILHEIPEGLGDYAARELTRRGIEIRVGTALASVDPQGVDLSDGSRIETATVVWTAGVQPNPALRSWGLPLDEVGRVRVDEYLRVEGTDDVWALGDCAAVPNRATPGAVDPPTSQHALRQARALSRNLTGTPRPYGYRMLGQVATLGRHKGIADVMGLRARRFPGWFITRTYHLYQLPLLSRKARVVADWTTSLVFKRDIAELSMLTRRRDE